MSEDYDYSDNDGISANESPADYSSNDGISPDLAASVMEGLGFTGINLDNWNWASTGDGSESSSQPTTGDFAREDRSMPQSQESSVASRFGGFLSNTGDFLNKYKTPLEMVARGLQSAVSSRNAEKSAQKLSESRIAELNLADQLKQNAAGRYSDSVTGLRKPGIINQARLQRTDGTQVYGANGQINRG